MLVNDGTGTDVFRAPTDPATQHFQVVTTSVITLDTLVAVFAGDASAAADRGNAEEWSFESGKILLGVATMPSTTATASITGDSAADNPPRVTVALGGSIVRNLSVQGVTSTATGIGYNVYASASSNTTYTLGLTHPGNADSLRTVGRSGNTLIHPGIVGVGLRYTGGSGVDSYFMSFGERLALQLAGGTMRRANIGRVDMAAVATVGRFTTQAAGVALVPTATVSFASACSVGRIAARYTIDFKCRLASAQAYVHVNGSGGFSNAFVFQRIAAASKINISDVATPTGAQSDTAVAAKIGNILIDSANRQGHILGAAASGGGTIFYPGDELRVVFGGNRSFNEAPRGIYEITAKLEALAGT